MIEQWARAETTRIEGKVSVRGIRRCLQVALARVEVDRLCSNQDHRVTMLDILPDGTLAPTDFAVHVPGAAFAFIA